MENYEKYVGQIFDNRYKIENLIGVGGMAVVYKALDMLMRRIVAVKILNVANCRECAIGEKYVPEIKEKENLPQIVLEILSSLNSLEKSRNVLIDISADGEIQDHEIADLIAIQDELERISITVETLQLWVEKRLSSGEINREQYERFKKEQ